MITRPIWTLMSSVPQKADKLNLSLSPRQVISNHDVDHARLTHWGRVTHICVRKLPIIGSDNGLSAPSHYLNQCRYIVNSNLSNKLQWNLKHNSYIFIQENAFENVVCKMASISSRPQWVNREDFSDLCHLSVEKWWKCKLVFMFSKTNSSWHELTHNQLEMHGCVLTTVATDALVLKYQVISIHSAD